LKDKPNHKSLRISQHFPSVDPDSLPGSTSQNMATEYFYQLRHASSKVLTQEFGTANFPCVSKCCRFSVQLLITFNVIFILAVLKL